MPHDHGYEARRYDDPSRSESWGLYSVTEKRWLPVLFGSKDQANTAAIEMAMPTKARSKRGKYE